MLSANSNGQKCMKIIALCVVDFEHGTLLKTAPIEAMLDVFSISERVLNAYQETPLLNLHIRRYSSGLVMSPITDFEI